MSFRKDPNEVLDFVLEWDDRLAGDTIVSSIWVNNAAQDAWEDLPGGLIKDSDSFVNGPGEATIWVSGGSLSAVEYRPVNRVTTAGGRTFDCTMPIKMKER